MIDNRLAIAATRLCAVIAAVAALSACASAPKVATAPLAEDRTALDQYAPQVSEAPDQVALAVHPQGLSPNQQAVLVQFLGRWRESDRGAILIRAPVNASDPTVVRRAGSAVSAFLQSLGIPGAAIQLSGYDARGVTNAPILASFNRLQVTPKDCSQTWDNLTSTKSNNVSTQFGCTMANNYAVQVADPHDLLQPAATDPADATRRKIILDKYRQGTITSTSKDIQASGTVSQQ